MTQGGGCMTLMIGDWDSAHLLFFTSHNICNVTPVPRDLTALTRCENWQLRTESG